MLLVAGSLALTAVLAAPPVRAAAPAKRLEPCSVLTNVELEPIFERPFRIGIEDDGGNCLFRKPQLLQKDDIVVAVMPARYRSAARAKQKFAKARRLTTELAGQVEDVATGDDAFSAILIGTDLVTMRVGRVVTSIRVENNDDDEAVYRDQAIAIAQAIAVRLATAP